MSDRSDSRLGGEIPKKFCASPWVEGVLRMNGNFATCCKNPTSMGDWTENGVENVWRSEKYQDFRRHVAEGKFPDRFCATCFKNGTAQSLRQLTQKPFTEYLKELRQASAAGFLTFTRIRELWFNPEASLEQDVLSQCAREIGRCEQLIERGLIGAAARPAVKKLHATVEMAPKVLARERSVAGQPKAIRLFMTAVARIAAFSTLEQLTAVSLAADLKQLRQANAKGFAAVDRLRELWDKTESDASTEAILGDYFQQLDIADEMIRQNLMRESAHLTVRKLRLLGMIVRDFLRGETAPEAVAPLRQSNLIAICNARCIHCPGLFSKEIEVGAPIKNGERFREMTPEQVHKSFERQHDVIDFFMNGSEFLFAKTWPIVAERLKQEGVRIRISTNGMLLTEKNARLLIDNDYLGKLNLSLDGATPQTIELVRARVKYDRVMDNLRFMLPYAAEKKVTFPMSMSFALMDKNYHELPEFVLLADRVRQFNPNIQPTIMVQPLAMKGVPSYGNFVAEHHPTRVDHKAMVASFEQMLRYAEEHKIQVFVFFTYKLADFVAAGCPIPPLHFQHSIVPQLEDEFV